MNGVFTEHYEITGKEALGMARAFAAERKQAFDDHWALVKKFGGIGFRPDHGGQIKTVMFKKTDKAPEGWRKVGIDNGTLEAKPARNTALGRSLAKEMALVTREPNWRQFADKFGWNGRSPTGPASAGSRYGMVIYFATGIQLFKPKERFFLIFPRELNDKWVAPKGLKLVRESEFMRALEDHNIAARKIKEAMAKKAKT